MRIHFIPLCLALAACSASPPTTRPATAPASQPAPGIARFDVTPEVVQALAAQNHVLPPAEWPLYQDSNLPVVQPPDDLRQHAAADPKSVGTDLGLYRVATMKLEGRRTYVFYNETSKTLLLIPAK